MKFVVVVVDDDDDDDDDVLCQTHTAVAVSYRGTESCSRTLVGDGVVAIGSFISMCLHFSLIIR